MAWPGLSGETDKQFTLLYQRKQISAIQQYAQRHERYYHVVDYATTGHTSLTFFNVGATNDVCNMNNGEVPTERPMLLTGLCITPQDLTSAGARSGAQYATSAAPLTRYEEWRSILQAGRVVISIADRPIFEAQDLTHFPSDGGLCNFSAVSTQATAALGSLVSYNNGAPIAGNRHRFPAPWPILPQKKITVTLYWSQVLTITTAGRIKVELVGESVAPLNL